MTIFVDATNTINSNLNGSLLTRYILQEYSDIRQDNEVVPIVYEQNRYVRLDNNYHVNFVGGTSEVYVDIDPLLSDSPHRSDVYRTIKRLNMHSVVVLSDFSIDALLRQRVQLQSKERGHEKLLAVLMDTVEVIVVTSRWSEKIVTEYRDQWKSSVAITIARPKYSLYPVERTSTLSSLIQNTKNKFMDTTDRQVYLPSAGQLSKIAKGQNTFIQYHEIIDELYSNIQYRQSDDTAGTLVCRDVNRIGVARRLNDIIERLDASIEKKVASLQFVLISIRPDDVTRCIQRADIYCNFVKEYIIVTRKDLIDTMSSQIKTKKPVQYIDEAVLFSEKHYRKFLKQPHAKKNWELRKALVRSDNVDHQFIMLDDDNMPLKKIAIDYFIDYKTRRYNAYYFEDLFRWKRYGTSYDLAQTGNLEILRQYNHETRMYSSHMPQVINRDIYREMIDSYLIDEYMVVDEWSTYFNYAISNYPKLFTKKIYQVVGWPAHPNDWTPTYFQEKFTFKNHYEELMSKTSDLDVINEYIANLSPYRNAAMMLEWTKEWCTRHAIETARVINVITSNGVSVISGFSQVYAAQPDTIHYTDIYVSVGDHDDSEYVLVAVTDHEETCTSIRNREYVKVPIHISDYGMHSIHFRLRRKGYDDIPITSATLIGTTPGLLKQDLQRAKEYVRKRRGEYE